VIELAAEVVTTGATVAVPTPCKLKVYGLGDPLLEVSVMVVFFVPPEAGVKVTVNVVLLPLTTDVLPKTEIAKSVVLEVVGLDKVAVPVPVTFTVYVFVTPTPWQVVPKSVLLEVEYVLLPFAIAVLLLVIARMGCAAVVKVCTPP